MINWILGGLITATVLFLIVRFIRKTAKGESTCCSGCEGCSFNCSSRDTASR